MTLRSLYEKATEKKAYRKMPCVHCGRMTGQWHADPDALSALHNCAEELLRVVEIAEKRPNKMGPHYMIWMDNMDSALRSLREKEGKI